MYKKIGKRIIASILVFCMIGTLPDISLLAREVSGTGAARTYANDMSGEVYYQPMQNGEWIASAFAVQPNTDSAMNAQMLKKVSFALDAGLYNGDITYYVQSADYTVEVYKYTGSVLDAIAGGAPDATVTGTYKAESLEAEFFAVNFDDPANTVTYKEAGETFLAFGSGESFAVKVKIDNATVVDSADTVQPTGTAYSVKTAANNDADSFMNGAVLNGKTVCIQAETVEASVVYPVTGISFVDSGFNMKTGDTRTIGVEYQPVVTSQRQLSWTTSNPAFATVDANGTVTAVAPGTVDITAASVDNPAVTATTSVTICKDINVISPITIAPQTYTGGQLTPTFTVKDGETDSSLAKDHHYTVTYGANENAGTGAGSATINGTGNEYLGSKEVKFDILPANMNSGKVTVTFNNIFIYDGNPVKPTGADMTVTYNNGTKTLVEGTDYQIEGYNNNTSAGNNASVTLRGIGINYAGTLTKIFSIKKDITSPSIQVSLSYQSITYSGTDQKPAVTVTDTEKTGEPLKVDRDYKVKWPTDCKGAGSKTIEITGVGAYESFEADGITPKAITATYEIIRRGINTVTMSPLPNQIAGSPSVTGLSLSWSGVPLVLNTDYTVSRTDNPANRTTTVVILGVGNYQGNITRTVSTGIDISRASCLISDEVYTGGKVEPEIEVYLDGSLLTNPEECFEVKYGNNIKAKEDTDTDAPYVKITGIGLYAGEVTKTFTIERKDISTLPEEEFEYTESLDYVKYLDSAIGVESPLTIRYGSQTLSKESDYTAAYSGNTRATLLGTPALIRITGVGNYKGSKTLEYEIKQKNMNGEGLTFIEPSEHYGYTGQPIEPDIKVAQNGVELVRNTDYEIEYGSNLDVGRAYARVKGKANSNYTGIKTFYFEITKSDIGAAEISTIAPKAYTGAAIKPFEEASAPTVTMANGTALSSADYEVHYSNNIEAGTATVELEGTGNNYTGRKSTTFDIVKDLSNLPDDSINVDDIVNQKYTGEPIEPRPVVTDKLLSVPDRTYTMLHETDYDLIYTAHKDVGTATIEIKGKGRYKGSIQKTFKIVKGSLQDEGIEASLEDTNLTFTGDQICPGVIIKYNGVPLIAGASADYTVTYQGGVNVTDVSYAVVRGGANFGDFLQLDYSIMPKELKGSDVANIASQPYTGSGILPNLVITDSSRTAGGAAGSGGYRLQSGGDYRVTHERNIDVTTVGDEARAIIEGRGNYYTTEKIIKNFMITQVTLTGSNTTVTSGTGSYTYTGSPISPVEPAPVVVFTNGTGERKRLRINKDFAVETIGSATNVLDSPVTYKIKGINNYNGEVSPGGTFTITQKDIDSMDVIVAEIPNQGHTGNPVTPTVEIKYRGKTLIADTDYTLTPGSNNTASDTDDTPEADQPSVTINGKGNFNGSKTVYFHIRADIKDAVISGMGTGSFRYTSQGIEPKPTVTLHGRTLVSNIDNPLNYDYELRYKNNINRASETDFNVNARPTVEIVGAGNYGGIIKKNFTITAVNMSADMSLFEFVVKDAEFTGSPAKPEVEIIYKPTSDIRYVLISDLDYRTVGGADFINVGTSGTQPYVTITPVGSRGNFYTPDGSFRKNFNIISKSINDNADIDIADIADCVFTGAAARPAVTVKDKKRNATGQYQASGSNYYTMLPGTDYDVNYEANDKPGTATVIVKGKGNYSGEKRKTFKITGAFENAVVTLGNVTYTGGKVTPTVSVTYDNGSIALRPNVDYTYEFFDNINCSEDSYAIITGINGYAGESQRKPFDILPKDVGDGNGDVKLKNVFESYTYTGEPITPDPILEYNRMRLAPETDYTCSYDADSTTIGRHKITITAKNGSNYTGVINRDYVIGTNFKVNLQLVGGDSYTYTGHDIEPVVKVTNAATGAAMPTETYSVEYQSNLNVGTATIGVYGKGRYEGDASITFRITAKNLGDADIVMAEVETGITYTGEPITPTPAVVWNKTQQNPNAPELTDGDFTYVYSSNTNAGLAKVEIIPAPGSNFKGSKFVNFNIGRKDISLPDGGITVSEILSQLYTGKEIFVSPEVKWGDKVLRTPNDYTLEHKMNKEIGTARVTVKGEGNYTGEIPIDFEITKVPIGPMTVTYEENWQYTGQKIEPTVEVSYLDNNNQKVIVDQKEYEVSYEDNEVIGTLTGIIKINARADGHYEGELEKYFTISRRSLKDGTVKMATIPSQVLVNGEAKPLPVITFTLAGKKYTLQNEQDYTLSYQDYTTVGQHGKVIVTGKGNFTDILDGDECRYYIGANLVEHIVSVKFTDDVQLVYNGQEQKPAVTVVSDGTDLLENRDYEIIYDEDCTSAGTYKAIISGLAPYGGSKELEYTIDQREISNAEFDIPNQVFSGNRMHPQIVGIDTQVLTVLGEDVSTAAPGGSIDKDGMTTNLNAFTTEITNNLEPGDAVVNITATADSNYKGSTTAGFTITAQDIKDSGVIISTTLTSQVYTGNELRPEVILTDTRRNADGTAKTIQRTGMDYKLVRDFDYEISYQENIYPGTAIVTIQGKKHYAETITKMFKITADLSMATIAPIPPQLYTGSPVCPELTVSLGGRPLGKTFDYLVSYEHNTDRGTAMATITPVPESLYTGSKSINFEINREIANANVTLLQSSFTYTGGAITPQVAVTYGGDILTYGQHYTVVYNNNVNVGTASLTVIGLGTFSGNISRNFTIVKKSIIRCDFSDAISRLYTGAPTSQMLSVADEASQLAENRDFTIRYVNNTNPGTATITISGVGNYGGVKTIRYNIDVPDMTEISANASAASVSLRWNPLGGVTGYAIYDSNNNLIDKTASTSFTKKKLASMKTYTYKVRPYVISDGATYFGGFSNSVSVTTTPAKPSMKVKAASKSIKVSWKKIKGVSGYEVYRSTSKKGKYRKVTTIKKSSTVSYTNKKLKSKKSYYYKVRAYKTVQGKKVYSSYSSVKSTKAK